MNAKAKESFLRSDKNMEQYVRVRGGGVTELKQCEISWVCLKVWSFTICPGVEVIPETVETFFCKVAKVVVFIVLLKLKSTVKSG